jgi:hypothetical protein
MQEDKVEAERAGEARAETIEEEPSSEKAVSLPWEIATLMDAIGAARVLADGLRADSFDDEQESRVALIGLSAVLSLVGCRMKDVARVVGGLQDPASILSQHNEIGGERDGEIRLVPWRLPRRRRWLKAELERVRAQLAGSKSPSRQDGGP